MADPTPLQLADAHVRGRTAGLVSVALAEVEMDAVATLATAIADAQHTATTRALLKGTGPHVPRPVTQTCFVEVRHLNELLTVANVPAQS